MVMGNNKLKSFRQFLTEEDGMGTVEVILIIVVLVGPVSYTHLTLPTILLV